MSDEVCGHFGKAPTYTLVDTKTGEVRTIDNMSEHAGGTGTPPMQLESEGVNIVLCGSLGPKAIKALEERHIEVFVGCTGTVEEALTSWSAGKLTKADLDSACKEHHH
ncbi:MAG: NifB/NifX family molybdenum-iron cluster-binding protein [Euryarchaeota archaeon]|nr:NifB/NifX family molybdenum-iron cluster-binding protein [Euryarchaeota archaeon]